MCTYQKQTNACRNKVKVVHKFVIRIIITAYEKLPATYDNSTSRQLICNVSEEKQFFVFVATGNASFLLILQLTVVGYYNNNAAVSLFAHNLHRFLLQNKVRIRDKLNGKI